MTRRRVPAAELHDPDALVLPADLLPDPDEPLAERLARSRAREEWFNAHGLENRRGDFVLRRNAELRGREVHGVPEKRRKSCRAALYEQWPGDDHDNQKDVGTPTPET